MNTDNERKIFVLYMMNSIGYALDYDTLHDVCVQDAIITSFEFTDCIDDLEKTGNIRLEDKDGKKMCYITPQGKHVSDTLNGCLLNSVKEKCLQSAMRYLSFRERGTKISHTARELPYGKYEFHITMEEKEDKLLDLTMTVPNKKELDLMIYNFENKPEFIYKALMSLLSGKMNFLLDS